MAFLDPSKPIATCIASDCVDCPVSKEVHCHFRPKELAYFLLICSPGFIVGGAGILAYGVWFLAFWIAVVFGFFGFLEIRVMCSHCPHYAEPGSSLKCWANYSSPKLWRYRPGPMSGVEKIIFFAGLITIFGYPPAIMLMNSNWLLAGLYSLSVVGGYLYMRTAMCAHCMNFACPLNRVEPARREAFFKRNPIIAAAWRSTK